MEISTYEFVDDDYIWFKLDDILELTDLTENNLHDIPEEMKTIRKLIDGTKIIQEPSAYFLIFFVSKSTKTQKMKDWLFKKVIPDIETKGYYIKGE